MKNYEKAYKEALKVMESLYNVVKYLSSSDALLTKQTIEKALPELKEPEDEKIRKAIINLVKATQNDELCLEYRYSKANMLAWLEKQGEQKPAWSEEDELMIQDAIHWINEFQKSNKCKDENDMQNSVTCENWLKSLKDRVQPQPKQECSEEDEKMVRSILCYLNEFGNWLSDKNEEKSVSIYKAADWLKSLKPNHWKPSEQNIKDLEWCADLVKDKMGVGFHRLQVFIDELKSL